MVLCDCTDMDVSLFAPDGSRVPSDRSGYQGAVYSFDVPSAGTYLAGIDMNECPRDVCVVGVKISGIKSGSVLAMLGIENGDRLETLNGFEMSNPEKMLEAYARLRSGADKLQIHLTRNGKPVNVDYTIR